MPAWVDSHCHLQEQFVAGSDHDVAAQLAAARQAGVVAIVCVGTDEATSAQATDLVRAQRAGIFGDDAPELAAVVGLHPHEAESDLGWLPDLIAARGAFLAGIGECGLDYYYEHAPKAAQRQAFEAQIALAHEVGLPLVIHAREAWDDLFAILDDRGVPDRTVLHCFTGGPAQAEACVERSMAVSFSGIATFKNAQEVRDAFAVVPPELRLVETDSPFLAPVPHRGQRNEPAYVALVGAALAESAGLEVDVVAEATTEAATRIFGLSVA